MNYTTRIAEALPWRCSILSGTLSRCLISSMPRVRPQGAATTKSRAAGPKPRSTDTALCALAYLWTEVGFTGEGAFKLARWAIGCAAEHIDILTGEVHEAMLHHAIDAQIAAVSRAQLH